MKKIIGFIHIYAVNDYKKIVEEQVRMIESSALIDSVETIYYVVIGDNQFRIVGDKYTLLAQSLNLTLTENFTLNLIRSKVKQLEENYYVFYIHTKGVTRKEKAIYFWRKYMEYFIISKWIYCIEALDKADIAGVNRRVYNKSRVHFNGNFWWANSSYIKTLPELSVEGYGREVNRWDGEFWIGDGNPTTIQLWNSKVHHQTVSYYPRHYESKEPRMIYFDRRRSNG